MINVNDKNFYFSSLYIEIYVLDFILRLFLLIVIIVFLCCGLIVGFIEYILGIYKKKLIGKILMYWCILILK